MCAGLLSNRARPALRVELETELRRDHHAIADRRERSPTSSSFRERAVDLGGIENVTPRSTAARSNAIPACWLTGGPYAKPTPCSEADGRNFEAAIARGFRVCMFGRSPRRTSLENGPGTVPVPPPKRIAEHVEAQSTSATMQRRSSESMRAYSGRGNRVVTGAATTSSVATPA